MKNKVKPPIDIDCRNCSECGKSGCTLDRCGYAVELNGKCWGVIKAFSQGCFGR
ncbi:MAG: hypothetical protein PHQ46_13645 [Negativicutes bacterium]|nr:hypothetical protein [Negativicutes bacterium]